MSFALILALFLSVVLLVTTAYFLLGSVPLLILKHDTPLDARFVGRFYSVYYRAAMFVAAATSICYALARLPSFALGTMAIALLSAVVPSAMSARVPPLSESQLSGRVAKLLTDPSRAYDRRSQVSAAPRWRTLQSSAS